MTFRALIFEPNEAVQRFLLLVLKKRGYECFVFERPGVCVMDLETG
jgi:hypothetical protein